jgi:hypothetical protein
VPPDGSTSVTGTSDILNSFSNLNGTYWTVFLQTGLRNAGYKLDTQNLFTTTLAPDLLGKSCVRCSAGECPRGVSRPLLDD